MIRYVDVLAALEAFDDDRREVLARFKAAGGSADRWGRSDRVAMADALSRVEDLAELRARCHWTAVRAALRQVRRRLEDEPRSVVQDARSLVVW